MRGWENKIHFSLRGRANRVSIERLCDRALLVDRSRAVMEPVAVMSAGVPSPAPTQGLCHRDGAGAWSRPPRANHLQEEAQADIISQDLDPRQAVACRTPTDAAWID